jgi:DNA modification methylase
MKLSDIKPNPKNPRILKDDKFKKLVQSLKDFPEMTEVREIVVNQDHVILGGNMRYKAMIEAGWTEAPVKVVDWSQEKQDEFIIKDNVSFGEMDWDSIANEWGEYPLEDWGLDLPGDFGQEEVEEDEAPEVSSEPAISKLGEIYQLGRHRVMCGDSTDAGNVALLMNGVKADMVFTDPPYGVNMSRSLVSGKDNSIKNDNLDEDAMVSLIDKALQNAVDNSKNNASLYLWIGFRLYSLVELIVKKYFKISNCIVWKKPSIGLGGNGYRFQHELCIFSGQIGDKSQSDLWEFDRDRSGIHPTIKPVSLVAKAINNSSERDDIILDLFLGSGSTLIACEQTNRICFGCELDEKYVDVIRKRYWKFTHDNNEEGWEDGTPATTN